MYVFWLVRVVLGTPSFMYLGMILIFCVCVLVVTCGLRHSLFHVFGDDVVLGHLQHRNLHVNKWMFVICVSDYD